MDEQKLLQCLVCLLDADPQIRNSAETHLKDASKYEGFGVLLAKATGAPELHFGVRQLAGVLLKQYVKEHWVEGAKHYEPPTVSLQDKQMIKQILPGSLSDPNSKIRTAAGMAIASIAKWDWPQEWPGLVEYLVGAIKDRSDENLVHGCLRCLSLLSSDIDEQHIPQIAPVLSPELLAIVNSGRYGVHVQRKALSIMHGFLSTIAYMAGPQQKQIRDLLAPLVQPWLPTLTTILASDVGLQDATTWGVRMEALKVLVQLVMSFSKFIASGMPSILAACWKMFQSLLPLYQSTCIYAGADEPPEAEVDPDDGDTLDLETLISQLLELVLVLVGNVKYQYMIAPMLKDLAPQVIAYMCMTRSQEAQWSSQPATYVADEDEDVFSPRAVGELLLDELYNAFGRNGMAAVIAAVDTSFAAARTARTAGQVDWWKLREAALLALGGLADHYQSQGKGLRGNARVKEFLVSVLREDLGHGAGAASNAFLVGRGLWVAARLAAAMTPDLVDVFLQAAVAGLGSSLPSPVRVGACRALGRLMPRAPDTTKQAVLASVYEGMLSLLSEMHSDTLHLVLELMAVVIKLNPAGAAAHIDLVLPPVLTAWSRHVSDPLVSEDALDVLRQLARDTTCLPRLAQQAVPTLSSIVSAPASQPPMLVEGSLDLLALLVSPAHMNVAQAVYLAVRDPLFQLLLTSSDSGATQSATSLLAQMVRTGGAAFLTWGGADAGASLAALLKVVERQLAPTTPEHDCMHVGMLCHSLVASLPLQVMGPHLGAMLELLVDKMQRVGASSLVMGLLGAVLQMAVLDAPQLMSALAAMTLTSAKPGGGSCSGLAVVMGVLCERHSEMQGQYNVKLLAAALTNMLAARHPAVEQLRLRGRRLHTSGSGGVRTRSQAAREGADQWSQVSGTVKLVLVLAQMMVEGQEYEDGSDAADLMGDYDTEGEGSELDGDDEGGEDLGAAEFCEPLSDRPSPNKGLELPGAYLENGTPTHGGLAIRGTSFQQNEQEVLDQLMQHHSSNNLEDESPACGWLPDPSDPIARADLGEMLTSALTLVASSQKDVFKAAMHEMTPAQLSACNASLPYEVAASLAS